MARLSYQSRKELPKKEFAIPSKKTGKNPSGKGAFPIPDASHARNALARVSQFGSSAEKAEVRSKVHSKFPGIGKHGKEGSPAEERSESRSEARREGDKSNESKSARMPKHDTAQESQGHSVAKAKAPAGHDTAKGDKYNSSYVAGHRGAGSTGQTIPQQSLRKGNTKGGGSPKSPTHILGD